MGKSHIPPDPGRKIILKIEEARKLIRNIYEGIRSQSPPHHFEFSDPFWVLITTILSHRTKDEVTDAASRGLFERYHDAEGLSGAEYDEVRSIISRVGFSSVKATRVIEAARIVMNDFMGTVPDSVEQLTTIPGVGRKTANVVLADSMGIPAIAVDTHVQRIARRIGLSPFEDPYKTEERLVKIVPREIWVGFNPTLVEFGKHVCRPVGPLCSTCSISEYCEFYRNGSSRQKHAKQKQNKS